MSVHHLLSESQMDEILVSNLRRLMLTNQINEAELARQTAIPQPTLHKILTGKTSDPRASTLRALADYFGVSVDELIGGPTLGGGDGKTQSVAILSWKECIEGIHFIKNLTLANWNNWAVTESISPHAYALISKPSMEPRFPKKTTLFIDPNIKPEDGDIVVVCYPNTDEATLREISIDGPNKLLLSLNESGTATKLENNILILGVLVKSSFSYHT